MPLDFFGRTYKTSQSVFIVFYKSCVHCVRSVVSHYKQNRNRMCVTAGVFNIVCEILENQPFIQCTERSSHFRTIIRRTDDKSVCFPDCIKNRSQAVPADTVPLKLFPLTAKAANTAGIFFQQKMTCPLQDSRIDFDAPPVSPAPNSIF